MSDLRTITCKNVEDNMSVILRRTAAAPWYLSDFDGLYGSDYNVTTVDNTLSDGSKYFSTLIKERNITLTAVNRKGHRQARALLYNVFKPRSAGVLEYSDGTITRKIPYYTEKCEITEKGARTDNSGVAIASISLVCPDPYFYDLSDSVVYMSTWMPAFQFPHSFVADGEEFGYRTKEKLQDIINDTGSDEVGLDILVETSGAASNITITNATAGETCKIGTSSNELSLVAGDTVEITTELGNRHVLLTHDGTKTEINYLLSADSSFPAIHTGHNVLAYDAESGVDNLSITITYRMRYVGV